MNFLGKLFGSEKALSKSIDGIYNGLDAIVFTEEEKARMRLTILEKVGDFMEKTSGQNLARRLIALTLVAQYMAMLNFALVLELCGYSDIAEFIWTVQRDTLQQPFNIAVGFYFFTQTVRDWGGKHG